MNIKRTIQFFPEKEPNKPDAKLRLRVKWNHNQNIVNFNVGYRVDVDKWSADTQRCKNNTTHGKHHISASIINREIGHYEKAANDVFAKYELQDKVPTKEGYRAEFIYTAGRTKTSPTDKTLFDHLDDFVSERGTTNSWTKSTYQKFNALKRHLSDFDNSLKFDDLNEKGLNGFLAHLRDVCQMRNTTIGKQLGFLKWFLRWATEK